MWLLAVFCFTHFTPDSFDLVAVNTDATKKFAAAQASGLNHEITKFGVMSYKGVQWRCCQKPSC